jgi:glycerophosphoryl diester phosphodiesterase
MLRAVGRAARRAPLTAPSPIVIGHRGASGYRPEHTLASYELAARIGADYIEPDLVITADGVLVARHEPELGLTTDVAERAEFADRRCTRTVDGDTATGWFVEDFTLAELKTLWATERTPAVRQGNTLYARRHRVATFQEILDLRARLSAELGRQIGVCVETKHEAHFARRGVPLEPALVDVLTAAGLEHMGAPVLLMSFEPTTLRALSEQVGVPLVQLIEPAGSPADLVAAGDPRTYADLVGPTGLADIAEYADAIGPDKAQVIGLDAAGTSTGPTGLVDRAHAVDLRVFPWTYRNENQFLPAELRNDGGPSAYGDAFAEYAAHLATGVDGLITDHPDTAVSARAFALDPVGAIA